MKFDVTVAGAGHTFSIHEPTTLFESLSLNAAGEKVDGVAFFPTPGIYHFFCAIPGHEAAGMKGDDHGDRATDDVDRGGRPPTGNPASAAG